MESKGETEHNNKQQNNDLKIELYPEKKPRYNFEKSSLKNLVDKDTLAFSFNEKDELAYINSKTPVLNGFYLAHSNHYPIRIKPDHIWLLIIQAFSNHVNVNAEILRDLFVDFDGKETLKVNYPLSSIEQVDKKILENFSEQINSQMEEFLGEEVIETLTPNFTTTDYNSTIICKISIMGAFKKYFKYEMHLCGCGVPYIILEGTAEDYEKIIAKAKKLEKYDFAWYINRIIPHIQKMVDAKKGNIDIKYFKNFIQDDKITEYVSGLSGDKGYNIQVPILKGWILNFFAYYSEVKLEDYYDEEIEKNNVEVPRFLDDSIKVKHFEKLANQMLNVPFDIVDEVHKKTYNMKYSVGFIGCDQNKNNEVFPVTGWIVSPRTKEDENNIL
jgi:hypothetical protein